MYVTPLPYDVVMSLFTVSIYSIAGVAAVYSVIVVHRIELFSTHQTSLATLHIQRLQEVGAVIYNGFASLATMKIALPFQALCEQHDRETWRVLS